MFCVGDDMADDGEKSLTSNTISLKGRRGVTNIHTSQLPILRKQRLGRPFQLGDGYQNYSPKVTICITSIK